MRQVSTSQNGYKSRDSSLIATYTVVRDVKLSLRKGDASVVLLHLARWFDKNIEPLVKNQCGGYNPRHIEGSKMDSNHASGTAEDLNWGKHVQHKKNTFTSAQQKKIRAQLKFYDGVIRWGGDYTDPDDMHFEINKGPAALAACAKKCKASDTPIAPRSTISVTPTKIASRFDGLDLIEVDGQLGPETILRWQIVMNHASPSNTLDYDFVHGLQAFLKERVDHRLVPDGKFGPLTIAALQRYLKSPVDGIISVPRSNLIVALQRRLNDIVRNGGSF